MGTHLPLVAVLFHLPVRDVVVKLGVTLLVLGFAHGVTMAILMAMRAQRRDEKIIDEEFEGERARSHDSSVHPVTE